MAARDDSVLRGSLITSLIVLVFSLALNFFLYRWGSTSSIEKERAGEALARTQNDVRLSSDKINVMKHMMAVDPIPEESFETIANGDAEMEAIKRQFLQDMAAFGPDVQWSNRNYPALPEYLVNAVRSRNDQFSQARQELTSTVTRTSSEIENARKALAQAEQNRDAAIAKLEQANAEFVAARETMKRTGEETRDKLTKAERELASVRSAAAEAKKNLENQMASLRSIVENQRQELNRLRSDRFENVQGEIAYVVPPGRMVHINLGSADALRTGVQFGVVDASELNVEDAELKAQIQVTRILGEHSAQARVIGNPSYRNPLVRGDKIYSPFWAPGRRVKVALAGDIDLTGDGRSNIEELKSMIEMAGAEVSVLTTSATGELEGNLDSSFRFLVVGEQPAVEGGLDSDTNETRNRMIAAIGRAKARAIELGVTPIPAWKLMDYLRGVNDTVTTPLGSAVRSSDFAPEPATGTSGRDSSTVLPEIYRNQIEGQRGR
jgi:archaellum component FlaC